jgi:hypothetical protein
MAYAEGTEVPVTRSRAEIEHLLSRYGATEFMSGWSAARAVIQFKAKDRYVRFDLPIPDKDDKRFLRDGRGAVRAPAAREKAWEAECRRRWRALALVIKSKLEAVETGIATFEHEFLAHIVMPGGLTVGEMVSPRIAEAYETGSMRPLLPAGPE